MTRTELRITYDGMMMPISGTCSGCGEMMPLPPANLQNSADVIVWLSGKYIEHRSLKHSQQEDRRRVPRD